MCAKEGVSLFQKRLFEDNDTREYPGVVEPKWVKVLYTRDPKKRPPSFVTHERSHRERDRGLIRVIAVVGWCPRDVGAGLKGQRGDCRLPVLLIYLTPSFIRTQRDDTLTLVVSRTV